MDQLTKTLRQVSERIEKYRGSRAINEENTKATLIDPVLRALGWDTTDLEEVQHEYRRNPRDKPVDYALLILRSPRLFVEAKALGQSLDDHRWANQIMGYAGVAGVKWVALTNGEEYRIFNSHAAVPIEEKLLLSVKVTESKPDAAETLMHLSRDRMRDDVLGAIWNAHHVDTQLGRTIETLFGPDPDRAFVRLLKKRLDKLTPGEIRASLTRARISLDFPMATESLKPAATEPASPKPERKAGDSAKTASSISLPALIELGVINPPLTIEKVYKSVRFTAQVDADGQIMLDGKTYDSLSTAGGVARATVISPPPGRKMPSTNGWTWWKFRDEQGQLVPLDVLRKRGEARL